jgi:hypothetical protein
MFYICEGICSVNFKLIVKRRKCFSFPSYAAAFNSKVYLINYLSCFVACINYIEREREREFIA